MPGPRNYTPATRTALAALSRGTCYYPDCQRPVVVLVDGEPYVDCQIAHIHDANPGNRYDADMSDDDRRAFKNLIFLCKPHHDLVDKRQPDQFPPEVLREWKVTREGDEISFDDPAAVTEDVIEEALSVVTAIRIEAGGLHLGGTGGSAIGAGGGGGGVIGSGRAGPGGPGSRVEVPDDVSIDLAGSSGRAPGAGGGGGGGLLPGVLTRRARPGEGREGRGYSAGVDGQDGQPTSFGEPDGELFIEALGGKGGLAGSGPRFPSEALGLSSLTLVNGVEIRDRLLFILGGAWQSFEALNLGDPLRLCLVAVFEVGGLDVGDYTASALVEDPSGETASAISFPVTVEESGHVLRIPRIVSLDVNVSSFGVWRVLVNNDVECMGFVDLMIKRKGVRTAASPDSE